MIAAVALVAAAPVLAQTTTPDVSTAPSAKNSGTGIPGAAGTEAGPAVKSDTVGSATSNQENPTVRQQDPSNIQGKPGNKSGPHAKQPSPQ